MKKKVLRERRHNTMTFTIDEPTDERVAELIKKQDEIIAEIVEEAKPKKRASKKKEA